MFYVYFKIVSRVSQVCVKGVQRDISRVFQGGAEGVSRMFKYVSWVSK